MATAPKPTTLFEYYTGIGAKLPSIAARAKLYDKFDLGPEGEYKGTAEQNTRLLAELTRQAEPDPDPPSLVDKAENLRDQFKGQQPREDLGYLREVGTSNAHILDALLRDLGLTTAAPGDLARVQAYPGSMNIWDALVDFARFRVDELDFSDTGTDLPPQSAWKPTSDSASYPGAVSSPLIDVDPLTAKWTVRGITTDVVTSLPEEARKFVQDEGQDTLVETLKRGLVDSLQAYAKEKLPPALYRTLKHLGDNVERVGIDIWQKIGDFWEIGRAHV